MRLHFPQGQLPDALWAEGRLSVGSGDTCRIRLPGIAANHVWIDVDLVRGIEMHVNPGAEVHVNSRPVREKAILRLGDQLLLGAIPVWLRSDVEERESPPQNPDFTFGAGLKNLSARATLRAVSGEFYGKVVGLKTRTLVGRGPECDLVLNDAALARQHAAIESSTTGVFLRDLGSPTGTLVNGIVVRDAVLKPGDQIAFEGHRFVLETIGANVLEGMLPTPPPAPINTLIGMKPVQGPVHTPQVSTPQIHTPVPVSRIPPTPIAGAVASEELTNKTNLVANVIMIVAAVAAVLCLAYGVWHRF